jgi:predicted ATP-dependent endonuclease of OLD family|tara:strand:+ start:41 stop:280 length:240 start_codon:yes stop_codon:yes gene_type:complete
MKLTQEDLKILEMLKGNKDNFFIELGQIKYSEMLLEQRNDNAFDFLTKLKEQEISTMKTLEDKYGKGSINLDTGEFTPE